MSDLVRITPHDTGAFWQVTFGGANGNILDRATVNALSRAFVDARAAVDLKAICLEGAGPDFSFGASIQEHFPEHVTEMIGGMRQLLLDLLDCHVVVLAAVRGRCLGGGLEVASVCHRVFASPDATFGQPEIAIGVFAPFASVLLPERAGRAHAEDLCLTGRTIDTREARAMGVVDEIADGDPTVSALAWARIHLARHSASSLRLAVSAIRAGLTARLREDLPAVEVIYLKELMASSDAREGLDAFLSKRRPIWKNR
jgi:cyclohexa-1,5-dienecarbonyl-CoA hydratase